MNLARLNDRPMMFQDQVMAQGCGSARLTVSRYDPGDERYLELRPDFAAAFAVSGLQLPAGLRWTLADNCCMPVAVGGLEPLGDRTWGAWGLANDLSPRAWAFVRKAAARVLDWAERDLGAREIHAQACATDAATALLARLGFEVTGERWAGADGGRYVPMVRRF